MCVYLTDVIDLMLRTAFIIVYFESKKAPTTKGIAADHERGN